jgi:TonB family protein
MKIIICLALMFISVIGVSQNDTIVYFSKLNKAISSKTDAQFYSEIMTDKRGNISHKHFELVENKWNNILEYKIQRKNDTSFSYYLTIDKNATYIRSFVKIDSGYYLKDYLNSRLINEGFSKTIFPEIRFGLWKHYDSSGKIKSEETYADNQLITNKYRIPDETYVKDVFTHVDKEFGYEGGVEMLLKFISENIKYPRAARDKNITGQVIIICVLMKDGSINGIDFLKRAHYLLDLEAIRVINSIPKTMWKPAEINGQKVNTLVRIPITFSITEKTVYH